MAVHRSGCGVLGLAGSWAACAWPSAVPRVSRARGAGQAPASRGTAPCRKCPAPCTTAQASRRRGRMGCGTHPRPALYPGAPSPQPHHTCAAIRSDGGRVLWAVSGCKTDSFSEKAALDEGGSNINEFLTRRWLLDTVTRHSKPQSLQRPGFFLLFDFCPLQIKLNAQEPAESASHAAAVGQTPVRA